MTDRQLAGAGPGAWSLTPSGGYRAIGVILVALGILLGRPDLSVLGLPMLLSLVWAVARPPSAVPDVRAGELVSDPWVLGRLTQQLEIEPVPGVETMRVRVSAAGFSPAEAMIDVSSPRTLEFAATTVRTGRQRLFAIDHSALGQDGVCGTDPESLGPTHTLLLPRPVWLQELPLPFQLQGLTGSHGSRRPGEGGDLRDVALFAPGDRLRRIDWKASARLGGSTGAGQQLYVRRTFATADAHVMLVVDPYDVVGPDVSTWAGGRVRPDHLSSLDIARQAAVSLARVWIEQGDRVGLVDLGRRGRIFLPAGGRRQLQRLTHHIALAEAGGEAAPHRRAPQIPSGAMVVLFSSFLDNDPADLARMWRHNGHRVLAVDVLPRLIGVHLKPHTALAHRMLMMEREDRLALLALSGVDVVRWHQGERGSGAQAPVASLTALARVRRRPGDRRL